MERPAFPAETSASSGDKANVSIFLLIENTTSGIFSQGWARLISSSG